MLIGIHIYRPEAKLREGNVFRSVCLSMEWVSVHGSLCRGGGLCPGGVSVLGVSVQGGLCPGESVSLSLSGGGLNPCPEGSLSWKPPPLPLRWKIWRYASYLFIEVCMAYTVRVNSHLRFFRRELLRELFA